MGMIVACIKRKKKTAGTCVIALRTCTKEEIYTVCMYAIALCTCMCAQRLSNRICLLILSLDYLPNPT